MKYRLRENISSEAEGELAEYPELTRHLLYHRGIKGREEASRFLAPDFALHTHDPFLMKGMEEAVKRILSVISREEKIVMWSDYDVDGIPGAVALHDFFKKIGFTNFQNYIPHRHDEGFGLNIEGVLELAKEGTKLIITIDCGITDVKEVARANELGMEVIVTDHHLPSPSTAYDARARQDVLPKAFAILNPKQADCGYPEKMLCGAGVVFKLIQGLISRLPSLLEIRNLKLEIPIATFPIGWEKWLLDMVGLATPSHMVPLLR